MPEPRVIADAENLRSGFNETGGALLKETLVKLATAGTEPESVAQAGNGERIYGVLTDDTPIGDRGGVQIGGRARVLSGAAVGAGVPFASDANGKAVLAATGDIVAGQTITAAGALDEVIEVELTPGGQVVA